MSMDAPLLNVTVETLDHMIDQVLRLELEREPKAYGIYTRRWNEHLKPLLEMRQFLEKRNKDVKLGRLNGSEDKKEVGVKASKTTAKN